jgi:hypothetical protein
MLGCLLFGGVLDLVLLAWLRGINGLGWVANAADIAGSMACKAVDMLVDYASDLVGPSALTEASRAAGLKLYALLVLRTVLVGFAQP